MPLPMYKSSTYLLVTYFPTYLPLCETYFPTELVTKVKPNITSVEVHPELSKNGHPVDSALVGASLLWPACYTSVPVIFLGGPSSATWRYKKRHFLQEVQKLVWKEMGHCPHIMRKTNLKSS
jgi:hypothetical protein